MIFYLYVDEPQRRAAFIARMTRFEREDVKMKRIEALLAATMLAMHCPGDPGRYGRR